MSYGDNDFFNKYDNGGASSDDEAQSDGGVVEEAEQEDVPAKKYTSVFDSPSPAEIQSGDLPTKPASIKVLGVGGAGNNAINRMIAAGVSSAEFIAVNTDNQALIMSEAREKVQIGKNITNGKGAGAIPEVGEKAALESQDELMKIIKNTDLVFITAGMGGGTGTGAAPVIARMAKDLGILTVAVVTKPFGFEGQKRMKNAEEGINKLRECVDTLLIIPNEKLWDVAGGNIPILDAFRIADDVLRQGIQGIADLIVIPSLINLDFADVCTIMKDKGYAHMGIGKGTGKNKTIDAVMNAIASPLLETHIEGATGVLIYINSGIDVQLGEVKTACDMVRDAVSPDANIIVGLGVDKGLEGEVRVTVIATGFADKTGENVEKPIPNKAAETALNGIERPISNYRKENTIYDDEDNKPQTVSAPVKEEDEGGIRSSRVAFDDSDIPPFLRKIKKQ